jgi:hypothetical protein
MTIMDTFKDILEFIFIDKRMKVLVTFFLVFYGATASPKLPNFILNLFKNDIFRVLILSLIVYKGNSNPTLSILVASAFIIVMNMVNKNKIAEEFKDIFKENFANEPPTSAEIAQKWADPKFDQMKKEHPGINSVCTKNLPLTKWNDSCVPMWMEGDTVQTDADCKETEISKQLRGDTPIKDATNVIYAKEASGEYSSRELLQYTVNTTQGSSDFGTCMYQYKNRKFPIKECTATGAAKCGNDEFPENMSEYAYCINPLYESGTLGSCAFTKKEASE